MFIYKGSIENILFIIRKEWSIRNKAKGSLEHITLLVVTYWTMTEGKNVTGKLGFIITPSLLNMGNKTPLKLTIHVN